ncbi:uncharacterized protein LOC124210044 [Daphnia pulex]|uniref:uncharacterized protein LOC124210044 n=1 Tax=Daphnia pulex TaxID=6669 RepID=UPI001EDD5B20|nr:uncharacterized protein LOC124210044 [Daphnia pulex]
MSSSVFSVNDNNGDSGSSFSNLLPVNVISEDGIHESVMLDANGLPSLPGLDEFCQNNDHVNAIYNMLGHSSNSEFIPPELCVEHNSNNENQEFRPSNHGHNGDTIFDINLSNNHCPSTSNNQDCPSSNHDSSTGTSSLSFQIRIGEPEESTSGPEPPLGTVIRRGISVIGQDQLMATPSTSQNYEGVTSEPNRVVNGVVPHAPEMLHSEDPNEEEIDEAFQNVFSGFSQAAEKEILVLLDADTLKHCLDHLRKSPLLICSFCHELFEDISPFQVHIQTCCSPPGLELKQKMDQAAMDQLARSLWKSVFLKELQNTPIGQNLKQHEGHLHNELNQIWLSGSFEPMLKCREIFIRAAVAIVSRRWVTNAVANELHRVRAIKPKQPKKRVKIDSDTDQSVADPNSSKSEKPSVSKKRKTRGRPNSKNAKKTTETDLAIRGLINDQDQTSSNTTQYHFTPETPVSDHGIDVMPVLPPSLDATEQSRLTNSREDSVTTPISDSGVDFTPEMDYELDRLVRGVPDVDLLAEAAKGFENLDNASDAWENNATADEPLSENEFVVGKILDRRLLYKVEDFNPLEEDYEYLVSWEGYGEEDNTWEPYEHLKHCTQKLTEYRERLKQKALRCRRGKRI